MTMKLGGANKNSVSIEEYNSFDYINGDHPWMQAVPEGYVAYRVRTLDHGKVAYFNFALAKEMGLILPDHPDFLNSVLEQKLIETFSLQIINEFDELNLRRIEPHTIRQNKYMATRYLQLQHKNKQGKTSGDGRSIWNGIYKNKGLTWDISSRGTGVTCLAPGSVNAKKPLKTGGTEFGYGCGLAEMDELIGASILAEKIHQQGVSTERVLCIIDLGKGYGIGVRAAHNLIRPAHLFLYLKQERFENLKASTDYLIQRQVENKAWNIDLNSKNKYDQFLKIICHTFAKFSAMLEVDYIFAWLDWDGDNVLADGGIIDYGSIRQFGLCHDKYRYDDVERFSTNLTEQKKKARLIIQVFAQLVDYLKTGHKKPLQKFNHHTIIKRFNLQFEQHRNLRLLYRMGFDENQRLRILKKKDLFNKFKKEYLYFEKAKITGTEENVPDGINHAALFNMRKVLRKYPQFLKMNFKSFQKASMPEKNFYKMMLSSYATASDLQMNEIHEKHIKTFQKLYKELLLTAAGKKPLDSIIAEICQRSEILNSAKRITGNALIEIVDEILTHKQQGLPLEQIQNTIDQLINDGLNSPEIIISQFTKAMQRPRFIKTDLLAKLMTLIEQHNESI